MARISYKEYLLWLAWIEQNAPLLFSQGLHGLSGLFDSGQTVIEPSEPISRERAAAWSKAKWAAAVGLIGPGAKKDGSGN